MHDLVLLQNYSPSTSERLWSNLTRDKMAKEIKRHAAEFKLKLVLALLKGNKTASLGCLRMHPIVLSRWGKQFNAPPSQFL